MHAFVPARSAVRLSASAGMLSRQPLSVLRSVGLVQSSSSKSAGTIQSSRAFASASASFSTTANADVTISSTRTCNDVASSRNTMPLSSSSSSSSSSSLSWSSSSSSFTRRNGVASALTRLARISPSFATASHRTFTTSATSTNNNNNNGVSYSLDDIMDSVIKVYTTSSSPNYLLPWQNKPLRDHTGSGFVIDSKRIITNAHVVSDALQVMVRRPGSPIKFPARVIASAHECDLALLEVDSDEFWEPLRDRGLRMMSDAEVSTSTLAEACAGNSVTSNDDDATTTAAATTATATAITSTNDSGAGAAASPVTADEAYGELQFSNTIPQLQDDVFVIGYPMGGDNACITQGVVSRVEPVIYAHAATSLLAVQIDAAINPGNSGGPAFVGGKVVGVAFQNIQNASNVGYIIPVPIIKHFLNDVAAGGYRISDDQTNPASTPATVTAAAAPAAVPEGEVVVPKGMLLSRGGKLVADRLASRPRGFCNLGLLCQPTSNKSLQRYLGMLPIAPAQPASISPLSKQQPSSPTSSSSSSASPSTSSSSSSPVLPMSSTLTTVANVQAQRLFQSASRPAAFAHFPASATLTTAATLTAAAAVNGGSVVDVTGVPLPAVTDVTSATPSSSSSATAAAAAAVDTSSSSSAVSTFLSSQGPTEPLTGILVNRVNLGTSADGILRRHDVLIAVDGHPIACDGTIPFRGRERIAFDYLCSLKYAGEKARLTFLRRKTPPGSSRPPQPLTPQTPAHEVELLERDVIMKPHDFLVSVTEYDTKPTFFVFGGIVFVPLTQPYLHEFGKEWFNTAPRALVSLALSGYQQFPRQEVVLIAQVLPCESTQGYSQMTDAQVRRVNGVTVRNMQHCRRLIERAVLRAARHYERTVIANNPTELITLPLQGVETPTGVSTTSPYLSYLDYAGLTLRSKAEAKALGLRTYVEGEADPDDVDPIKALKAAQGEGARVVCDDADAEDGLGSSATPSLGHSSSSSSSSSSASSSDGTNGANGSANDGNNASLADDVESLILELADMRVLVIDIMATASGHNQILTRNRVPVDRSDDMFT